MARKNKKREFSQKELAELVNVTEVSMSRYISGDRFLHGMRHVARSKNRKIEGGDAYDMRNKIGLSKTKLSLESKGFALKPSEICHANFIG